MSLSKLVKANADFKNTVFDGNNKSQRLSTRFSYLYALEWVWLFAFNGLRGVLLNADVSRHRNSYVAVNILITSCLECGPT